MAKKSSSSKELSYEEAYKRLGEVAAAIESSGTGLEETLTLMAEAKELITLCRSKLKKVEEQLETLNRSEA